MTSRQSGIRPPNVVLSKIVPPTSVSSQGMTSLPRPSGMKTNVNPIVPIVSQDSPVHSRRSGTPQSTDDTSQRDMDSLRRFSDSGNRRDSDILTEDTDSFIIGEVVWVGGSKRGKIAFIGDTHFAKGEWAGIVLDSPVGKNDGMVSGIRYFQCDPLHGTFTRLTRLTRQPLPPYDTSEDTCFVHGDTPPRYLGRSPSPFRSKSPSPGTGTPTRLGSPSPSVKVGDRVIVQSSSGTKRGILRFIGQTMFAPGEYAGIELDQPIGKNDGSVGLHRYFTCPDKYGLFAPIAKVSSSPANRLMSPLRKYGSRESMLSNLSSVASSSAPRTPRNPMVPARTGTQCLPTCALQSVLQEKEKHLERLMRERDLNMSEVAQANRYYEENQEEFKKQIAQTLERMAELEAENKGLRISLEEERKQHEDLLFAYEEEKINQADLEIRLCGGEKGDSGEAPSESDTGDLASLRLIVHQYSEKLKQREREISTINEQLSKQKEQLEASTAESKNHMETIKKLKEEVAERQKQIRYMEESLAAEIVHSQHAIATVERAHAHKLEEITNFGKKVEELSSTVINSMAECVELQAQKIKLEDEMNHIMLAKTFDAGDLEIRLKTKEEETSRLQDRIKELQQLNACLTSIWESNVQVIQDGFKLKEAEFQKSIKEIEEKLSKQTESTEKTISSLHAQLGLKKGK